MTDIFLFHNLKFFEVTPWRATNARREPSGGLQSTWAY